MKRIAEFDGMRGVAALLIVVYHWDPDSLPMGWMAVDLFFVLSGYLITNIVLRDGGNAGFLRDFYVKRALRIWPIYYMTVVGMIVLSPRSRPPGVASYYMTFTQETPLYWGGRWTQWLEIGHTWTLAVEEQFYMFWPVLLLLLGRRRIPALCLACVPLALAARLGGFHSYLLLTRCDGLALGGLLAVLTADATRPRRVALALAGAGALLSLPLLAWLMNGHNRFLKAHDYGMWAECSVSSLLSLAAIASLVATRGRYTALLRNPALVYLGTISYGIYLYHLPLCFFRHVWSVRLGLDGTRLESAGYLLSVVLAAALSWHFVESPLLRLKGRLAYRKTTATEHSARVEAAPVVLPNTATLG